MAFGMVIANFSSKVADLYSKLLLSLMKLVLNTLNSYVTWCIMCERYVTFVKDYGFEVKGWRDKRLTKGFAMYIFYLLIPKS